MSLQLKVDAVVVRVPGPPRLERGCTGDDAAARGAVFESVPAAMSKLSSPAVGTRDYALGLLHGLVELRGLAYTAAAG